MRVTVKLELSIEIVASVPVEHSIVDRKFREYGEVAVVPPKIIVWVMMRNIAMNQFPL